MLPLQAWATALLIFPPRYGDKGSKANAITLKPDGKMIIAGKARVETVAEGGRLCNEIG